MTVYIVLVKDRHCDPEIKGIWKNKDKALEIAKRIALNEIDRHGYKEDYEERFFDGSGIIAIFEYSCESDAVYVFETEIKD